MQNADVSRYTVEKTEKLKTYLDAFRPLFGKHVKLTAHTDNNSIRLTVTNTKLQL